MTRLPRILFGVVFSLFLFFEGAADALVLNPSLGVGQGAVLGSITASYDYEGDPSGFPTMVAYFEYAPSGIVPDGADLRWFQVVTYNEPIQPEYLALGLKPATWRNKDVNYYGMPFTDSPKGGYDYQRPAGDDNEPFYWHTEAEWPEVHKKGSDFFIVDTPKRYTPGVTSFETYLTLHFRDEDPETIYLLEDASFSWQLSLVEQGPLLAIWAGAPKPLPNANTPENAAYLEEALANAGFANWRVEPSLTLESAESYEAVPKPPSPGEGATKGFPGFPAPGLTHVPDRWGSMWERTPQAPSSNVDWQGLSVSPGAQSPPGAVWERTFQAPPASVGWQGLNASPGAQSPPAFFWERAPQVPATGIGH